MWPPMLVEVVFPKLDGLGLQNLQLSAWQEHFRNRRRIKWHQVARITNSEGDVQSKAIVGMKR